MDTLLKPVIRIVAVTAKKVHLHAETCLNAASEMSTDLVDDFSGG